MRAVNKDFRLVPFHRQTAETAQVNIIRPGVPIVTWNSHETMPAKEQVTVTPEQWQQVAAQTVSEAWLL